MEAGEESAITRKVRIAALLIVVLAAIGIAASLEPILQNPSYHAFAGNAAHWGIPNAANVLSNAGFLIAGLLGLSRLRRLSDSPALSVWRFMFVSVILVCFGSGYYHLQPSNWSLVWDRLPMSLGFAAMMAGVYADRVDVRTGLRLFPALTAAAAISVVYWWLTERAGAGDLRPYLMLQYLSMVWVPLVILLFPAGADENRPYWLLWAFYLLAKFCELYDREIFEFTRQVVSGHTLKHLAAAVGLMEFRPRLASAAYIPRVSGKRIALLLALALFAFNPVQAGPREEMEKARDISWMITLADSAYPGHGGVLIHEALRREGWTVDNYEVQKGLAEPEFSMIWRKTADGQVEYWLTIAGSSSIRDWVLDFDSTKTRFEPGGQSDKDLHALRVHRGFNSYAKVILETPLRWADSAEKSTLTDYLRAHPAQKIHLVGHCLGGATVTLISAYLYSRGVGADQVQATNFGAPAVGNEAFENYYSGKFDVTRLAIAGDPIPEVPPQFLSGYHHVGKLVRWIMSERIFLERHYKKFYLDMATKRYYDRRAEAIAAGAVEPMAQSAPGEGSGRTYVAVIRNELTRDMRREFPYIRELLLDEYRKLLKGYVLDCVPDNETAGFEALRAKAAAAGCDRLLIAAVWDQFYGKVTFPYSFVTLEQSVYRVSDGSLIYSASFQDGSRFFAPLEAVKLAAAAMKADSGSWTGILQ